MPNEIGDMEGMLAAAASAEMEQDSASQASQALEDISDALAEVDAEDGEEKIFTVVSELRGINQKLGKLLSILEEKI